MGAAAVVAGAVAVCAMAAGAMARQASKGRMRRMNGASLRGKGLMLGPGDEWAPISPPLDTAGRAGPYHSALGKRSQTKSNVLVAMTTWVALLSTMKPGGWTLWWSVIRGVLNWKPSTVGTWKAGK